MIFVEHIYTPFKVSYSTYLNPMRRSYTYLKYARVNSLIRSFDTLVSNFSKSISYKRPIIRSFCHTIKLTNEIIKDILE
jgi:hypothetical protein